MEATPFKQVGYSLSKLIERQAADFADRCADSFRILRSKSQKIDIPRHPCHGDAHAHQQQAALRIIHLGFSGFPVHSEPDFMRGLGGQLVKK